MAVFKCKMCGGALEINSGDSVAVCEYCNTKQTLPRLDDEKRTQLYDRANYFRRENEFDKAMGIYEMILSDAKEDCESYWGIVLCRYGIEYVEDPRSHKRIPTVNRAQFTSVFEDEDYKNAVKYADALQKEVYEAEASVIDKIQRGILAISQKEEPFDVFICYKETDSLGNRTQDSVYAQDIYTALTKEGYKVFFSKITLEDKLGSAYEPYIFAALNSAKVMLVVGTTKDNFNAVWVKNEWSRFLSLIKQGKEKTLIPVYKDISPYEMPEEFQFLQSQDMGKIGYLQDLIRGISKLVEINKATVQETVIINQGYSQAEPLLKRAFMFLEDGDFVKADEFCEQALNIDPENARAYLGKLMVELKVKKQDDLKNLAMPFNANANYQKIIRFADDNLKSEIIGYLNFIANRNEQQRLEGIYTLALNSLEASKSHTLLLEAAERFESISSYKDSSELAEKCREKAVIAEKDYIYNQANQVFSDTHRWNEKGKRTEDFEEAANLFRSISGWRNADEMVQKCLEGIDEIKAKIEEEQREQKRLEEVAKRNLEKRRKRDSIIAIIIAAIIVLGIIAGIASSLISPIVKYNEATELMESGEYSKALYKFEDLGGYKDSEDKAIKCKYNYALQLIDQGDYEAGYAILESLGSSYIKTLLSQAEVGEYVLFGTYEQDDNDNNGKEFIEWLVLDKQDDRILVISKYVLDNKPYNESDESVTWETCTLRSWLNYEFYNTAFSYDEKALIPTVTVTADKNPSYKTNAGNDTQDKIFLLSVSEAEKYFSSDDERICDSTAYAEYSTAWWLRTPGYHSYWNTVVFDYGTIFTVGNTVNDEYGDGVRPAMWLETK